MFWFNWIKAANRGFTRLSLQMTDDQAGRSGEYTRCCKVSKILTSYKWYPCLLGDACNAASSDCWTASWREHHSEFSLSLSFHVSFTWFKRCVVWCGFRNHHNSFCMVKDRIQRDFIFNFNAERERDLSLILRQRIDQIGVQHVPLIDDLTARYFVVSIDLICMTMLNRCQQLYFGVLGGLNDKVILDKIMSRL